MSWSEATSRRLALPILAAAMNVSAVALLWWGRDLSMQGDDLFYAERLSKHSLGHAILYSNVYLIAAPLLLYKPMFELIGIGAYMPYRIVEVGLVLLSAGLFYTLARCRIGDLFAIPRRSSCSSSVPVGTS